MPVRLAEADKPEYIDTAVDFGSSYRYFVQALAGETRQSEFRPLSALPLWTRFPRRFRQGLRRWRG